MHLLYSRHYAEDFWKHRFAQSEKPASFSLFLCKAEKAKYFPQREPDVWLQSPIFCQLPLQWPTVPVSSSKWFLGLLFLNT